MKRLPALFVLGLLAGPLSAQSVCDDGDCAAALYDIQLNEPRQPADRVYSAARLTAFRTAYEQFAQIEATHRADAGWQGKYTASTLSGRTCLRFYDLHSRFAYEYDQNPDFKAYLDRIVPDPAAVEERGFRSSRRGMNLQTLLARDCPREVRRAEQDGTSSLGDRKAVYQRLGEVQGYWDATGKILKPLAALAPQPAEPSAEQRSLLDRVKNLSPDVSREQVDACVAELQDLLDQLERVEQKKEKRKRGLGKLLALPGKLLGKVTDFLDRHAELKTILSALPAVGNVVNLVDGLFGKSRSIATALDVITGKQSKLSQTLDAIDGRVAGVRRFYEDRVAAVRNLRDELVAFTDEKTALVTDLSTSLPDLTAAEARLAELIRTAQQLNANSACSPLADATEELAAADRDLDAMEPEIEEMEAELSDLSGQVEEIARETDAVAEQIAEVREQGDEVAREEEAIREEYGREVKLAPVTVEEWSESFAVERPYWEATFHPDDEVVEGYRGRYFQVQLKNADKVIRLLFGPGEYHMSKTDFRKQYGSVIGAFVTEALAAIKQDRRAEVKLFVQGSADISGAGSFRGNLDEDFRYDELTLLPLRGSENFAADAVRRTVPTQGFTNEDLPNLRGRFLQEMIGFYSKKLTPILLEGSVKKKVNEADRNAVIYLFLPESLLAE